ncbi:hypothetical protein [Pantoea septica]|uniref:hypothetical protein n=1 Tax=Pantoea septica TaxID=472695 RepID=UPI001C115FC6|nr:hypothetical protein [Pantoea septica]MBU5379512.1 hypothetical protein [Pantoea septica]
MQTSDYKRRGNQISLCRRWTVDELQQLKELAATTPPKVIARKLNRSYESVRQRASRSRIRFLEERSEVITGIKPNL